MTTAITYARFGGPDVLTVDDLPIPVPAPDQILIRVRAAGVNLLDAKLRRGDFAEAFQPRFPVVPGLEASGVVIAVGRNVVNVAPGDEVFGVAAAGGYAADALLAQWVRKPESISWEVAAAISVVGETAFRTLGHLQLTASDRLLIHGAAGSVGSLATQLAVSRGVEVIGTARPDDLGYVRSLGATAVAYGDDLVERVRAVSPDGVDAVLDTAGAGVLPDSIELAGGPDRVITIADGAAFALGVRFTGADPADHDPTALPQLAVLFDEGRLALRPVVSRPLSEARAVHAELEAGRLRGKVVLIP